MDKSVLVLQGKDLAARQARSAALAKVKQAYVTALTAQRTLALRQEIARRQESLQKQMESTWALKQASDIDLETARINAKSAELDVESSTHDLSLALRRLANLMGLPPDSSFAVAEIDVPPLPAKDQDEAISKGMANRVDAAQLDISVKSSGIDLALAVGSALPAVTLSGKAGAALTWGTPNKNGESATLGVSVAMPIMDAGAAKSQIDAARAAEGVYAVQASQLRKNIEADIRDYWWAASIQLERIDAAKRSYDLATQQESLVQSQKTYGTATNQDLLNAAVATANTEVAWLKARSDYLLAILSLETAMGL